MDLNQRFDSKQFKNAKLYLGVHSYEQNRCAEGTVKNSCLEFYYDYDKSCQLTTNKCLDSIFENTEPFHKLSKTDLRRATTPTLSKHL